MRSSYKSLVVEMSLYYGLIAFSLPLVYAVTNQLSFAEVLGAEWFAVTLFIYPSVLILSAIRYGYRRRKTS